MRIEVLVNLGTNDYPDHPFLAGETHEVSDAVGASIVAGGHAVVVKDDAETQEVKAQLVEPAQPAVAEPESVSVSHESKQDKPAKASLKSSKEK